MKINYKYLVERKTKEGFIERIWVDDLKGGLKGWKVIKKEAVPTTQTGLK